MKEHIKVNIHSVIDAITNSSTEIFINTNNVGALKEFINGMLKSIGSDKTFDDIFEVQITEPRTRCEYFEVDELILIPKDTTQEVINFTHLVQRIFSIDATYNG